MTGFRKSLAELVGIPPDPDPPPVTARDRWTEASRYLDRCQQAEERARQRHNETGRDLAAASQCLLRAYREMSERTAEFREDSRLRAEASAREAEEARFRHEEWMREFTQQAAESRRHHEEWMREHAPAREDRERTS